MLAWPGLFYVEGLGLARGSSSNLDFATWTRSSKCKHGLVRITDVPHAAMEVLKLPMLIFDFRWKKNNLDMGILNCQIHQKIIAIINISIRELGNVFLPALKRLDW